MGLGNFHHSVRVWDSILSSYRGSYGWVHTDILIWKRNLPLKQSSWPYSLLFFHTAVLFFFFQCRNWIPFSKRKLAFAFVLGMNLRGCNQKWVSSAGGQVRASLKYLQCGISVLVSTALLCRSAAPGLLHLLTQIQLMVFGLRAATDFTNSKMWPVLWPIFVQNGFVNV